MSNSEYIEHKTGRRLAESILLIMLLLIGLGVTTYALAYTAVSVEENIFHTGSVSINLNDGKPVITEKEFLFEPGMTVEKDFFIKNESTIEVYYKVYFSNVEGSLADVLDVTIKEGDNTLFSDKASELTKWNAGTSEDGLSVDETTWLTITFHFPEEAGNVTQDMTLAFDLCADAVQAKNNPSMVFE